MKQKNRSPLRINVGFLLHQSVGSCRKFEFDEPTVQITDDLDVYHLHGDLHLTRTSQGLYAEGLLKATLPLECVRCLSDYKQEIAVVFGDLFVYPPTRDADPLLTIPETGILDLSELLREYFILALPIQPLCRSDCPGLCAICGQSMSEGKCEHPEAEIDPRLAILQTLLPKSRV